MPLPLDEQSRIRAPGKPLRREIVHILSKFRVIDVGKSFRQRANALEVSVVVNLAKCRFIAPTGHVMTPMLAKRDLVVVLAST